MPKYCYMLDFLAWLLIEDRQMYFDFMKVPAVSPEEIKSRRMFGPVYHGTTQQNHASIGDSGFRVPVGSSRQGDISNGYEAQDYSRGIPPPIHHLGYGVYFTTSKNNAKMYNHGVTQGLVAYYIDAPKLGTINWGATNTMMKWWQKNGYDMMPVFGKNPIDKQKIEMERVEATKRLTAALKSQYDAIWYKGKGIGKLLDGDQIVVFDPSRIYRMDNALSPGYDVGGGIQIKPGTKIVIKGTKSGVIVLEVNPARKDNDRIVINPWTKLLGQSPFELKVKMDTKARGAIVSAWKQPIFDLIMKSRKQKWFQEYKERFRSGDFSDEQIDEQIAERIANFYISNLDHRFPSNLVERTVKPGERIK